MKQFPVRSFAIATLVVVGLVAVAFFALSSLFSSGGNVPHRGRDAGSWSFDPLKLLGLSHEKHLVAVMVENHETARPYQEGVQQALLVEEFPVEGFITRFALVFDADHLPKRIGPVRSLRPYFIDALQPWVSTVIHAGGSPEAFAKAAEGDITAINLLFYYGEAERDPGIPEPHNLFVQKAKIEELLTKDLPETEWPPYAIGDPPTVSSAETIRLNFYNPAHDVQYTYQPIDGTYQRSSGDVDNQGEPRNVLILEIPVTGIGEMGRLTIPVLDNRGRALLFQGGRVQEGTWAKGGLSGAFTFKTKDGRRLLFASGQTWLTALPSLDRVKWE